MAPHSSTLAWKIAWTGEPGRMQSMGSLRVGHDWATSLSRIGEGNSNPLQCSCLENPRDGGACWAAIYGVAQSQTRLTWLSSSSCWLQTEIWSVSYALPIFAGIHNCFSCSAQLQFGVQVPFVPHSQSLPPVSASPALLWSNTTVRVRMSWALSMYQCMSCSGAAAIRASWISVDNGNCHLRFLPGTRSPFLEFSPRLSFFLGRGSPRSSAACDVEYTGLECSLSSGWSMCWSVVGNPVTPRAALSLPSPPYLRCKPAHMLLVSGVQFSHSPTISTRSHPTS